MAGYARVINGGLHMWIRFERVGRGEKFDILLDAFHTAFPLANWDEYRKAWQLPVEQLGRVVQFCNRVFGSGNVKLQNNDTSSSTIRQLAFW